MTYTALFTRYDNELDYLLVNSFGVYAEIDRDNREAKKECEETLNRKFRNTTQIYPERVSKKVCQLDERVIIL